MVYPRFTDHALRVLEKRYLKKDAEGRVIESPEEMFWRVALNVAEAERLYSTNSSPEELSEAFFRMMASLDNLVKTRKDCHCERSEAISPPITH